LISVVLVAELFEKLDLSPAYKQVASILIEQITSGSLEVGRRLPSELELARQFGVNRSTIREALRELESAGLVRRHRGSKLMMISRPDRGAIADGVSRALSLHQATILEVWETMMLLEPTVAEWAARRRSAEDLRALQQVSASAGSLDAEIATAQAAEFFRVLAKAAHNEVTALTQEPLLQLLEPSLRLMIDRVPQARSRIANAQRRIVAAVESADAAAARSWCEKHVRDYRRGFEVAGINIHSKI
jgi:DNA-binding FadR family transcriptional regulator